MIQYQFLRTCIIRIVWETVRRITNEIFGLKGLTVYRSFEKVFNATEKFTLPDTFVGDSYCLPCSPPVTLKVVWWESIKAHWQRHGKGENDKDVVLEKCPSQLYMSGIVDQSFVKWSPFDFVSHFIFYRYGKLCFK